MLQPNRHEGDYRYSFNGMEKDDEVKGNGNHLDFGARCYDSRLGRWLSLDAYATEYPSLSDYVFVANSPIIFIDPDGNKIKGVKYNSKTGQYSFSKSAIKRGTKQYVEARIYTKSGRASIQKLVDHKKKFRISVTDKILVSQGLDDKYVLSEGSTTPMKNIVITLNNEVLS